MSPSRSVFPFSPATVKVQRPEKTETWVGSNVSWRASNFEAPYTLTITVFSEEQQYEVAELVEDAPGVWSGTLSDTDPANPVTFTVQPTGEGDVIGSLSLSGLPQVPMPLSVISNIINSDGAFTMPTLYAMTDDEGYVATMMLATDAGIYVRYSSAWYELNDLDVVDGLNVNNVDDTALDMYDQFDRAGQLIPLTSLPLNGDPQPGDVVPQQTVGEVPEPTIPKSVPMIASLESAEAAVEVALTDPDLQWYVERRVRALGFDIDLPWSADE